jgi:DNA-binding SARP family transcriptional activator/TolB-like protein
MFRLKLFGSPALERGDGSPVMGRATQRHRLALLAILSLAPSQRVSRDKLIGYLWPEATPDKGRNSLNVATYVLRAELGESALISEGEDLRLNTGVIRTDVAEFDAAVENRDHVRAAALYPGPFLDGFFLAESAEFEQWVTRERQRLAGACGKSLELLAESAEADGDLARAVEWWTVRVAHDPFDSRIALRLMQALDASGNRAGALRHATTHGRLLQREFGVDGSPEIHALAERLRADSVPATPSRAPNGDNVRDRTRQSPVAQENVPGSTGTVSVALLPMAESPRPASGQNWAWPRKRVATVVLLSVVALTAAAWYVRPNGTELDRSVVVLPFINIGPEEDSSYFADGLTEEIIASLSSVPELKVISRSSAMHYKASGKSPPVIAKELGVANVLQGSVRRSGGSVRISAQLVRADTDRQIWARNYDFRARDIFGVQDQVARDVVRALEVELGEAGQEMLARRETRDPEAYELYLRGRFHWGRQTKEGHEKAIEYFSQAIERDSSYAAAYAGLADAYVTGYWLGVAKVSEEEAYSRLKWAAERVLALDEQSADARTSLAIVQWCQQNWPGAEREFRKALELNPSHATARSWYAQLLSGLGRHDEALRESRRAYELDRFALLASSTYAWRCYLSREYDCAIEQFHRTLEINPAYAPTYMGLARAYAQKGLRDEAMKALAKAIELAPESRAARADLAYVHALFGESKPARDILAQLRKQGSAGFAMARAYAALGEADSAFALLENVYWKWPYGAALIDPGLDRVRSDPRFARLSARIDREMGLQ